MGKKNPRAIEKFQKSFPDIRRSYVTCTDDCFHQENVSPGEQTSTTMSGEGTGLQDKAQNYKSLIDISQGQNRLKDYFPGDWNLFTQSNF